MSEFLVIGGGVIGLMTTLQLADAGHSVTVVERSACGSEASWAGGGIVSPLYPWRYSSPVSRLASWSEGAYPELALRLLEETGIDPEYRQKGLLYLRVDDEARALAWARQVGKPLSRVGAEVIHQKEPNARRDIGEALWMPTLGSIRNPRLMRALRSRLEGMTSVTLREGCRVTGFKRQGERLEAVETDQGDLCADQIVICAGAWSAELAELAGTRSTGTPGQGPDDPVQGTSRTGRASGLDGWTLRDPPGRRRVLAGSTLEDAGFDKGIDDDARSSLWHSATGIIPALVDCEIEHHWAGLRPGSPDGVPYIGKVPGWDNLHVNAGHYRNGLVLAPASTRLLVDQLLDRESIIDPAPYRLQGRMEERSG